MEKLESDSPEPIEAVRRKTHIPKRKNGALGDAPSKLPKMPFNG